MTVAAANKVAVALAVRQATKAYREGKRAWEAWRSQLSLLAEAGA